MSACTTKRGPMIALGSMPLSTAMPGPRIYDPRADVGALHLAREELSDLRADLERLYVAGMCTDTHETITEAYGRAVMTLSSISEYLERIAEADAFARAADEHERKGA